MSFYSDRTVLVAGGSGLIGSHVAEELVRRGARVVATHRSKDPLFQLEGLEWRRVDLTTAEGCSAAVEGCDLVVNAAADTSGAFAIAHTPLAHVTKNVILNALLMEASYTAGVERVLFCSTSTVYPDSDEVLTEERGFEGDPHPVYFGVGWMKRYTEKLMSFYQQKFDMVPIVLRFTMTYGPRDKFDFERSHVLPALIRRALELEPGQPLEVWGDGTAERDFLYVTDTAQAVAAALEHAIDGQAINIGLGESITIGDAARMILRLAGRGEHEVRFDPTKPTTIQNRKVDFTRAQRVIGWQPEVSLEDGLRRTLTWYKEQ